VVLAEAAKANLPTLHVLQNLACGLIPTDIVTEEGGATDHSLLASHHHNVKQGNTPWFSTASMDFCCHKIIF